MAFSQSAGVYPRIIDRSFTVSGGGLLAGGVVITADKGPIEANYVTSGQQFIDTYGLPSRDNPTMYAALRFINRAPAMTVVRATKDALAAGGELSEGSDTVMSISAANPGTWGNNISVNFADITGVPSDSNMFAITVRDKGNPVERFEVSRDPEEKNGYGNSVYVEDVVNSRSAYIKVTDNAVGDPLPSAGSGFAYGTSAFSRPTTVTLSGGTDDSATPSPGEVITAFNKMTNTDEVEAQILINAGWTDKSIQTAIDNVAKIRDDAVAILDIPRAATEGVNPVQDMVQFVAGDSTVDPVIPPAPNSHLSGMYGGWIKIYDQFNDREVVIPPSGDVAATFVQTVEVAERWDAPAGLRRGIIPNTLGVTNIFDEGERDLLYTNRINPVTTYGGAAAVIWGQKTLLNMSSALNRFNVVNSVLWMQGRMSEALKPFVFQPNTQFTRDNIDFLLTSFLENIQTRGGLYDFFVDMSDNTPVVIDRNELIVNVHLQPVRTAEYLRLNLIIDRTGISYGN